MLGLLWIGLGLWLLASGACVVWVFCLLVFGFACFWVFGVSYCDCLYCLLILGWFTFGFCGGFV